jgi:hypothetical protein
MQVGTNLGHYQSNARVTTIDRSTVVSEPVVEKARYQPPRNPSFSQSVLSHNLANVLWEVGGSSSGQVNSYVPPRSTNSARDVMPMSWVLNAYAEHD